MTKSLEQRLYEEWRDGRGVRLSADDVHKLVGKDDAIGTRITNAAATEAGVDELGGDSLGNGERTWEQLKTYIVKECS